MKRKLLAIMLTLILLVTQCIPATVKAAEMGSSPSILIAYFSWSGHTKQIAEEIHAQVGGDLFEITPKTAYTKDINKLSGIALKEQEENARPALSTHVKNMEQYDIVFVGYPCWWSNMPMPVFTFLEEYSFAGKTVIPFTAYGESVFGDSISSIKKTVPNATIATGLAVQEHNMQNLSSKVSEWLKKLNLGTGKVTQKAAVAPKRTSISGKIKAKTKGFTVKWKKQSKSTTGYQVQYSTSKKFTKKTTVAKKIKKTSTTKLTVKKLKSRKKYYVRVRTYQTVNGKKYYSGWSKVKSVTTKK